MENIFIIWGWHDSIDIFSKRPMVLDSFHNFIFCFFYIFFNKRLYLFHSFSCQEPFPSIYLVKIIEIYNLKKYLYIMIYSFFLCCRVRSCFIIYYFYQIFSCTISLIFFWQIKTGGYFIKKMLFYILVHFYKIKPLIFSKIHQYIFFISFNLFIYPIR